MDTTNTTKIGECMKKRKFQLPSLDIFQKRLEDYFNQIQAQREKRGKELIPYMEKIYEYYQKGMSINEIAKALQIPRSTVHSWLQKIRKIKDLEQKKQAPLPEASDFPKEQPQNA